MKPSLRKTCLAASFSFILGSLAPVMSQAIPLDVINLLISGNSSVSHTSLDIGPIINVFDGDNDTLARTPAINPMVLTLNFTTAQTLSKSRVWFLAGNNRWRVETANSHTDLDAGSGSFRVALDWSEDAESGWREREFPQAISCKHVRLKLERLTGDGYVHLNEWQLFTETGTGPSVLTYDLSGNTTSVSAAAAGLPVILTQPMDAWASANEGAGLSVVVSSGSPVTYQWKRSPSGTVVNGATGDSLFFPNLQAADEGAYQVVITNATGSTTSTTALLYIDANGNRLPDTWELTYFGNLDQPASGDYDADGVSNAGEYQQGSNPTVNPSVPSITYWIADSGSFTTASNWSLGRVPVAGDTAVINQGTVTLPTTAIAATVVVNKPFEPIADVTLRLTSTGRWRFNGLFRPANGTTFTVTGSGGQAIVAGPTFLNDCGLTADGGATLTMETVAQYAHPGSSNVWWQSLDSGSRLVFPNLLELNGSDVSGYYFRLQATGGTVSLPELTSVHVLPDGVSNGGGVRFNATSSGVISAPKLTTFEDLTENPESYLYSASSGRIVAPLLLAPVGMGQIYLGESSDPFRFTSLPGVASFTIHSGTGTQRTSSLESISEFTVLNLTDGIRVNFPRLNSINSLRNLFVDDGAKATFDSVTNYSGPGVPLAVNWRSRNAGTVLSFPELATITGTIASGGYLYIDAESGSRILLPKLQVITKASDGSSLNTSRVELKSSSTGSMLYAPSLYIFSDNDVAPKSEISQGSGSSIVLGRLSQQGVRGVTLSGITLPPSSPLPQLELRPAEGVWQISLPALAGRSYQLKKSKSLAVGSWNAVGDPVGGQNDWLRFNIPQTDPKAFFRVEVAPWP